MKLEEARRRRLWTLRELAEAADIGLGTVHRVERGQSPPTLKTIRKISQALGVDPMEIDEFRAAITGDGGEENKT